MPASAQASRSAASARSWLAETRSDSGPALRDVRPRAGVSASSIPVCASAACAAASAASSRSPSGESRAPRPRSRRANGAPSALAGGCEEAPRGPVRHAGGDHGRTQRALATDRREQRDDARIERLPLRPGNAPGDLRNQLAGSAHMRSLAYFAWDVGRLGSTAACTAHRQRRADWHNPLEKPLRHTWTRFSSPSGKPSP